MDVWSKAFMFVALCILCVVASIWDLKWRRIPNSLIVVGLATGLFLHLLGSTLWNGVVGLLVGAVPWVLADLVSCGGIGGGDIKFYAMCGFLLDFEGVLVSYCVLAVVSVLGLGVLCLLGKLRRHDRIPFGPLIGVYTIVAGVVLL